MRYIIDGVKKCLILKEPARRSANAADGPERGYARLRRHEILQADRGSDFDFLRKHLLGKVLR
jgi:hypothetical protein